MLNLHGTMLITKNKIEKVKAKRNIVFIIVTYTFKFVNEVIILKTLTFR